MQRLGDFVDDLNDIIDTQQVIRPTIRGERASTLNVFGYDVVTAVFLTRIEDRHDVRVLQHADHVCFVKKHLAGNACALGVNIFFNVVDLNRDVATIVRIMRQINHARAALADLVDNDVFADLLGYIGRAFDFANWTRHFYSTVQIISHRYKPSNNAAYRAATRSSSIIPRPPSIL